MKEYKYYAYLLMDKERAYCEFISYHQLSNFGYFGVALTNESEKNNLYCMTEEIKNIVYRNMILLSSNSPSMICFIYGLLGV